MLSSCSVAVLCLAASVSAHGFVSEMLGANKVVMPGLSVMDGTTRDCSSNGCGSQADTAIIRDGEIKSGAVGPLGKTQGGGPIDPAMMIKVFMGDMDPAKMPTNGPSSGVGQEDNLNGNPAAGTATAKSNRLAKATKAANKARQLLAGLLGGIGGGGANGKNAQGAKSTGPPETRVKAMAGTGASSGMPTANDDGTVDVTFRQINQDGAGPLEAMVDGTSGGTDMAAFKEAQVVQNVPGLVAGISATTTTDFPVKVQMPAGMTCDATVGSATNVCVLRLRNNTPAGPFGGAAAYTQTPAARKRALEYRRKMKKARAYTA